MKSFKGRFKIGRENNSYSQRSVNLWFLNWSMELKWFLEGPKNDLK
jgi:hypothetical protein